MARSQLIATQALTSALIADMASKAIRKCPNSIREILLSSKNEQTFSGLLASELALYPTLALGNSTTNPSGFVLLEFKGKDYIRQTEKGKKKSRNFHDLSIVDEDGEINLIIENKFWYHFDGCKGKSKPKPEKGIRKQLEGDIFKIRQTLSEKNSEKKGFILLNVVTPGNPNLIPPSYLSEHKKVWDRTRGDIAKYRQEGLDGVLSVVNKYSKDLRSISIEGLGESSDGGFIDFICAEVALN
jgi:hypothetical protein